MALASRCVSLSQALPRPDRRMDPQLADLESPELRASRANVRHLRSNLGDDEKLVVVAEASDRPLRLGLLAASDSRLLFVRHPIIGTKPIVLSVPFSEIIGVEWKHEPLTGIVRVRLADRTLDFKLVQPKARTWAVWWTVKSRLEER
jgi:hypothetical protein